MANATKAILILIAFLGFLIGLAYAISWLGGYPVGRTVAVVVGIYLVTLPMYACFRRTVQKLRELRIRKQGQISGQRPTAD